MISESEALNIKERHEMDLLAIQGVQGIGLGEVNGERVINVYVAHDTPKVRERLPDHVEGCRVVPVASGEFQAYSV